MEQNNSTAKQQEISLKEIVEIVKVYWRFLLSKWLIICIVSFGGATLGLVASLLTKPSYTAHLSFSLVEENRGGGLADLASSFGLASLAGGTNGAFSGDNLLEIIKSQYAIEKTLLTPVNYHGKTKNLAEVYIDFSELRKSWLENKKNIDLQSLSYPIGQKRETFSRTQDSVLFSFSNIIRNSKILSVARKDKKTSIVDIEFTSSDELFSKLFVETLMDETYRFYKDTKTSQSRSNLKIMQHTADSIKGLYEAALYKGAGYSSLNINAALQLAAVPRIKQEQSAQLYGTVYAEVLKNLETLKLDMARVTPMVQMIDTPRLPLKMNKLGKAKGLILGGLFGGFMISMYLILSLFIKSMLKEK